MAAVNLVVAGSEIDQMLLIMVAAADSGYRHWIFYAFLCVGSCTMGSISQGGDVWVGSHPNLQFLNDLSDCREGFKLIGTSGASAPGHKGHHGGWLRCQHGYIKPA